MNILLAPDKFKGSLSAKEVCEALIIGLQSYPHVSIEAMPMADGGEGTCELLTHFYEGNMCEVEVYNPCFEKIKASYGISKDGSEAFIEMSSASGLQLIKPSSRNPLLTTTFGTGQLIHDALDKGVKKILIGIGGSGTNDAGIGMAEALGFRFYDLNGAQLKPIGASPNQLHSIAYDKIHPRIKDTEFIALCDVDNALYGSHGAAYTYAPQKGADANAVKLLDDGLRNFENVIVETFGFSPDFAGAGAGGGLAGGAKIFLNISIHRGMEYIIKATGLDEKIKHADLIITGEGKIDQQTLAGKVVMEVARLCMKHNKEVVAIAGKCELRNLELQKIGISQMISLMDFQVSEEDAIKNAFNLVVEKSNAFLLHKIAGQ